MNDLWTDIKRRLDLLDIALREVKERGREYATAEMEYRTALAETILQLKAKGTAATITPDIARGTRHVANLRLDRDCKEALYKAALEAINTYKLQIRVLESQLEREWRG